MSESKTYQFDVQKMKCGGCVANVEKALSNLPGVETFEVSLQQHRAEVVASVTADEIADTITASGYPASLIRE